MKIRLLLLFSLASILLIACQPAANSDITLDQATVGPISNPANGMEEDGAPATVTPQPPDITPLSTTTSPAEAPNMSDDRDEMEEANADVEFVRAVLDENGSWTFHVTVRHPDKGREDYADGWDVLLPDGTILRTEDTDPFTRLLLHPHVSEQPFTRSQGNLMLPEGTETLVVRAHDILHGFGGKEVQLDLSTSSGQGYEIQGP